VHFEVETREKINDSGSSSSAPIRLRDAWGGEAGHLTALRELGKLAMLSNTIDDPGEVHAWIVRFIA
jgi:E3 ubiquitin-protein ligase UBR1/E3 ubiquitin-protein ligase UBR3